MFLVNQNKTELLKQYNSVDQKKLFVVKPLYQRSLIVAAGPFANFLISNIYFFFYIHVCWKRFYSSSNSRSSNR